MQNLILSLGAAEITKKCDGHTRAERTKFCFISSRDSGTGKFIADHARVRARFGGYLCR